MPERAVPHEPASRWLLLLVLGSIAALCLFAMLPPALARTLTLAGQVLFLVMTTFRLVAPVIAAPVTAEPVDLLAEAELPIYTVLVALHREAAVVPRLIQGLAALDYPAAKLDIKLLIEADDPETAAALARIALPARFAVITVPPGMPRTKPRALNAALPLARGALLTVYDAEDVPDPGQLRLSASLFARLPERTACLQGRLVIDNADDSRLARAFALEYAGLFDVLNPALARLDMPVPLGGPSMHLRTRILRALHGWDPWNVTEDADLGMRLALAGYAVGDLPSATIEEAPARLGPWLAQRTRWLKGLMQTSLAHGRRPRQCPSPRHPGGALRDRAGARHGGFGAGLPCLPHLRRLALPGPGDPGRPELPGQPRRRGRHHPVRGGIRRHGPAGPGRLRPARLGRSRAGGALGASLLPAGQPGRLARPHRVGPRPGALEQDPARSVAHIAQRPAAPAGALRCGIGRPGRCGRAELWEQSAKPARSAHAARRFGEPKTTRTTLWLPVP
ncbi:glycosyltransferase family 2 protein [Methylobacterium sp. GXS13]|uniref:glycosyltransferase family 2 protein n=1 Tax=Methylobacterium sp. GXS13 TaxID=1730094 RepID=UPI001FCD6E35|nr:glycosyltransferase family 2 protein [Methylobacterium sp. GXS13]